MVVWGGLSTPSDHGSRPLPDPWSIGGNNQPQSTTATTRHGFVVDLGARLVLAANDRGARRVREDGGAPEVAHVAGDDAGRPTPVGRRYRERILEVGQGKGRGVVEGAGIDGATAMNRVRSTRKCGCPSAPAWGREMVDVGERVPRDERHLWPPHRAGGGSSRRVGRGPPRW